MKKVGAILAAVAMVVVAFVIRGGGDGSADGGGGGSSADTIICPTDFREICDEIDGIEVMYRRAGQTADDLIAATNDDTLDRTAWVVPAAWADAVQDTRLFDSRQNAEIDPEMFAVGEPIASTNVAIAYFEESLEGSGCEPVTWSCLVDQINNRFKVGSPELSSASGLPIAAAQLVEILGTAEFGQSDIRLPTFTLSETAFRDMRTIGPASFAAVGTTGAAAEDVTETNTGIPIVIVEQPDVRIDLVILTREGASMSGDTRDAIAEAFLAANWEPPGSGPSGLPGGDLLNVIREKNS